VERTYFIVDDDAMQNEIHSILLRKVDPEAKVYTFLSSKAAFDQIDSGNMPDLIFLDLNIPGEGQKDFLEEHRSRNCTSDIYLMSSAAYLEDSDLTMKYTAVKDFVNKPLLDYKLRSIIGHYA
jgi:response regulator of citrate/malate metabolism